jgi:glycosyltransferase involved in cell wall biosynthesis
MTTARPLPVSIVILTLNEEKNLPLCLASVAGAADVVVFDSGSTDRTVAIARAAGARVFTHPFRDFAQQRNQAQAGIPFAHPWVFHLDADEQMTPELLTECAGLPADVPFDGYFVAPRMMFHGQWLRRCTDYPAWQARLVRATGFKFVQVGHGQRESPDMRMGFLQGSYLHDISVPDLSDWQAKHRRYAREEADRYLAEPQPPAATALRTLIFGPALERRRTIKHLSYRLPFRPALRFLYQYVLRGGFLDGRGAFRYCRLLATYELYAAEALRPPRRNNHG